MKKSGSADRNAWQELLFRFQLEQAKTAALRRAAITKERQQIASELGVSTRPKRAAAERLEELFAEQLKLVRRIDRRLVKVINLRSDRRKR